MRSEQNDPESRDTIREIDFGEVVKIVTAHKVSLELRMIRLAIFCVSLAVNMSSTIPTLASQCTSPNEIAASLTRWAAVRRQFVHATDQEIACRVLAASFYESVATRQAATTCAREVERDPAMRALDSEINAFNNLLSAKCGT